MPKRKSISAESRDAKDERMRVTAMAIIEIDARRAQAKIRRLRALRLARKRTLRTQNGSGDQDCK
jgi:hypothetical protein